MWNDPALAIDWPVGEQEAVLSDKDKTHPLLKDLPACF
jgi:dTDP-4-dehydrorhamnose 3,5-epimerase